MARILHTAVADQIHEVERTDPDLAAEMRMEPEYANEVRGMYDDDLNDPADFDDDGPDLEPDEDELDKATEEARNVEYDVYGHE